MKRLVLILLFVCTLIGACARDDSGPTNHRLLAMATWVDIAVDDADRGSVTAAIAEIEAMLRQFERDYYAWGDGELAQLNAALAAGEPFDVSPAMGSLLVEARSLSIASDATFDPGAGRLIELWGFNQEIEDEPRPPDRSLIESLVSADIGMSSVEIDAGRVQSQSTQTLIDLGGIAKGRAVDNVLALLGEHQIVNAMVNAGGDLRVAGTPAGRMWRVGIQSPRGDGLIATVELASGEAAFTSGDYERFYDHEGQRWHHLLDPATGFPAIHTQAVTVIATDGVTADAAATALFVAGPQRWPRIARQLGVDLVLRVDATGLIESTPAMRDRLQISPDTPSDIISIRN